MKAVALALFLTVAGILAVLFTPLPVGSPHPSLAQGQRPSLAIDAISDGDTLASVVQIDSCAMAQEGDTFDIDLIIEDVTDLLAWEVGISYDPNMLEVRERDVQMFQAANPGSQVLDTSNETPSNSGRYVASAVDVADPASPDSGSGVLARITFEAVGEGTSPLSLKEIDLNDDGAPDQGPFLRDVSGEIIGDEDGDTFFDGPTTDAEIRIGEPCPGQPAAVVQPDSDDDGTNYGLVAGIAGGVVAGLLAAGALAAFVLRRRATG